MIHYSNTGNPIDFPKGEKKIPMLERFAAQSLVEYDGELIFSKERFAELIVQDCIQVLQNWKGEPFPFDEDLAVSLIKEHFGI